MKKGIVMFAALFLVLTAVQITPAKTLNNPPEKPTINGPTSGEAGKSYTYTAVSTDPDGDKIFYCFNWGDGNEICTDLYPSGQQASASHTWESKGDYTITVKATDEHGAESEPATLKVSMPLSYEKPSIRIIKPRNGIYIFDIKILPILGQIVIGDITVKTRASDDVSRVDFLLQMSCGCGLKVMHTDTSSPFTWEWNMDYDDDEVIDEGIVSLTVRAYDSEWQESKDAITILKL